MSNLTDKIKCETCKNYFPVIKCLKTNCDECKCRTCKYSYCDIEDEDNYEPKGAE